MYLIIFYYPIDGIKDVNIRWNRRTGLKTTVLTEWLTSLLRDHRSDSMVAVQEQINSIVREFAIADFTPRKPLKMRVEWEPTDHLVARFTLAPLLHWEDEPTLMLTKEIYHNET